MAIENGKYPELTEAILSGLDDLIPELHLDPRFTWADNFSTGALQAFYHWPRDVAQAVTRYLVGGVLAHSTRDPSSTDSGPTTVGRLALIYSSREIADDAGKRLADWLADALPASSRITAVLPGPKEGWGQETLWSITSVYGDTPALNRVDFGWRRSNVIVETVVFGVGDVTSHAVQISSRLDSLVSKAVDDE